MYQFQTFHFHSKMNKLTKNPKQTQKSFPHIITKKTPGQIRSRAERLPDSFLSLSFSVSVVFRSLYLLTHKMCLILLLHYIYTQKFPFEGCFLMILQENPAYTIFFFEEPRNHLFLQKNVNVSVSKEDGTGMKCIDSFSYREHSLQATNILFI